MAVFDRGVIVLVPLDPTIGHQQVALFAPYPVAPHRKLGPL
jgi:hypothetical protein